MNNKYFLLLLIFIFLMVIGVIFTVVSKSHPQQTGNSNNTNTVKPTLNPLSIETMRNTSYPGSNLIIEQTLKEESNYKQYIASFLSEGLKIYGLITIPNGIKPESGWPVIIFNHGYLDPKTYKTTDRYVAYVDAFANNGYIVFKPDYRGHGNSQGKAEGSYYSPGYAIDVLNAVSTLKLYPEANPNKIGMWGHSMGGNITLRDIVVDTKDIKAAVIWGGVVGNYNDLMNNWQRKVPFHPAGEDLRLRYNFRQNLIDTYGTPVNNPTFWNSIDPTAHLADITTPIQLHTGGSDEEVPVDFSVNLFNALKTLNKTVEYYNYPGGNHNISSPNFQLAMQRSIEFFNKYLK